MAKVWVSLVGANPRAINANSVDEVIRELGDGVADHFVMVNKEPADRYTRLAEGDFVTLTTPVKGG